jgi:hypothetical protein
MTDYEASKMARTGTDLQEVIRELFKRQNMKQTKAPTMVPKTKEDQVQWIQLMRRSNITNKTTTMMKINPHLYNEDSVTGSHRQTFGPVTEVRTNLGGDQTTHKQGLQPGYLPLPHHHPRL